MSTTTLIDTASLRERMEKLRSSIADQQKQVDEIAMLLVLAEKYTGTIATGQAAQVTGAGVLKAIGNAILRGHGETKRSRIISACSEVLSDGQRRLSRELTAHLRQRGIEVRKGPFDADKEAAALASYLSKEKDIFVSDVKEGGWTLKRMQEQERARLQSAGTLRSLFDHGLPSHPVAG